ncbi:hypothetical protein [Nostoc sp.]|uniref:hypothetical protein n=1 Tax=Nostoc sp. TaxID=1180 RepID=UPI002FF72A70
MIGQLSWRSHLDFWSYGNNFSLSHFFKFLPDNFDKSLSLPTLSIVKSLYSVRLTVTNLPMSSCYLRGGGDSPAFSST